MHDWSGVVSDPHPDRATLPSGAGQTCYLPLDREPLFATLHLPGDGESRGTGVVICPPFGWDELGSHRSLRVLAMTLARAGYAALRFDFPGTGDSGGSPRDPQRLDKWTAAVDMAARSLRERSGCERIVAFGIGLGGMAAFRAAAAGSAIDDLVLWSVPSKGRLLVRELRAFARVVEADDVDGARAIDDAPAARNADADLNVAGFLMTAQTVADLESLDLTRLALADASSRRVLLLGRDRLRPDRGLVASLESAGVQLQCSDGPGYGAMMVDPYTARVPNELFARLIAWLGEADDSRKAGVATSGASLARSSASDLGATVGPFGETPFEFCFDGVQLSGVLTAPASGDRAKLCVVLLNAGAVRRIGPQRMWVEAARRWAPLGVATLRFDVIGVGDSDGAEGLYTDRGAFQVPEFAQQVICALDALQARGIADRFVVGGVCSGAYWALHTALADERVSGLLLMNMLAFFWSPELGTLRDARQARALLEQREVLRMLAILATERWRLVRMLRTSLQRGGARRREGRGSEHFQRSVVSVLDELRDRAIDTLLLFSLDERLYDDFVADGLIERLSAWPNMELDRVLSDEHIFRPLWCQRHVHRAMDRAVAQIAGSAIPLSAGSL